MINQKNIEIDLEINDENLPFDENEEKDEELENSEEKDYEVSTQGTDWTLEVLCKKIEKGDILVPAFQRKIVWNDVRRSKLIDSFLKGFPVPNIFLYKTSANRLEVIDGQQRLWAIKDFFDNKYTLRKTREEWNDKRFVDLVASDKLKLEDSVIRATIISSITPENPEIIFRIFERLNTGGMKLNDQEIRNGIWGGALNDVLKKLNENKNWRILLDSKQPDNRYKDVEMILRFFVLSEDWANYKKPMNEYLTKYLSVNRNEQKKETADLFIKVMDVICQKIGKNAFKLDKGINKAFFDAVSVGVAQCIKNKNLNEDNLSINHDTLRGDEEIKSISSDSTTNTKNLKRRIEIAYNLFKR